MKDPRPRSAYGLPSELPGSAMSAAAPPRTPGVPGFGDPPGGGTAPFIPAQPYQSAPAAGPDEGDDPGLAPGAMLGKYQIIRKLGSGGMGSVYEAIHTGIAKAVALKTLSARLASESRAETRFLREAAAASRLDHPHVVAVTDFGADAGVSYLVMEILRGDDLGEVLAREPHGLSVDRTADVMLAVCAGVFAAHQAGVIHRDLKPQNIFLARTPVGEVVPKVLDFGISKLVDEEMRLSLTGTGTVVGTTQYLSPEQVSGHAIDGRSDQYTLGVILYECVTGQRPHDGDTLFAVMRSIAEARFHPPRALRPELPPAFEAVILRAMSTDPAQRFESVYSLGRALLPFASPKRRMLWADYFQGEEPVVPSGPVTVNMPPTPMPGGGTRAHPYGSRAESGDQRAWQPQSQPPPRGYRGSPRPVPPPSEFWSRGDLRPHGTPWFKILLVGVALVGAAVAAWRYLGTQSTVSTDPVTLPVTTPQPLPLPATRPEPLEPLPRTTPILDGEREPAQPSPPTKASPDPAAAGDGDARDQSPRTRPRPTPRPPRPKYRPPRNEPAAPGVPILD